MSDDINKPRHYTFAPIEVIEVIDSFARRNAYRANVIKYVCRADHKGCQLADLKKARWYLDREIQELENERIDVDADSGLRWDGRGFELDSER